MTKKAATVSEKIFGHSYRVTKFQLIFALCLLLPGFIEYLLPLIVYKTPIYVDVNNLVVGLHSLLHAFDVALCWFTIVFVCIIWPFKSSPSKKQRQRHWHIKTVFVMMLIFTGTGTICNYINHFLNISHRLDQFIYMLSLTSIAAIVFALYLLKHHQNSKIKISKWFYLAIIGSNGLVILICNMFSGSILYVILLIIVCIYTLLILNFPLKKLALTFFILLCLGAGLQVFKAWSRMLWEHGQVFQKQSNSVKPKVAKHKSLSAIAQDIKAYQDTQNYSQLRLPHRPGFHHIDYVVGKIAHRLNLLGELGYVVQETPKNLPFIHGRSYELLLTIFVPRFVWPNKPIDHLGVWYGQRYHFVRKNDFYTDSAITMVTEAWINFGWFGVMLSALLFGLFIRLLWWFFIGNSLAAGNLMLAAMILLQGADLEPDTYRVIGNLIHATLFFWIVEIIIRYFNNCLSDK